MLALSACAGKWSERKKVSVRAFHEWMPTRSGAYGQKDYIGEQIGRTFEFGNLAKLVALENRLTVRCSSLASRSPYALKVRGANVALQVRVSA